MMFPATVVQAKLIFHELGAILPWAESQEKQPRGPGGMLVSLPAPPGSPRSIHCFLPLLFLVSAKPELESTVEKETQELAAQLLKCWVLGWALGSAHCKDWSQVQC